MLASGKAVIAAAQTATEVGQVVAQTGLLVPPEDTQALVEAIDRLADAPALRGSLGARGRQFAEAQYARKSVLPAMHTHLLEIAERES